MIKIYGASDDLIEIDGDLGEELNYPYDDEPVFLAFDNGYIVKVFFGDVWYVSVVSGGEHTSGADEEGDQWVEIPTAKSVIYGPRVILR